MNLYHYTLVPKLIMIKESGIVKRSPHDRSKLLPYEMPFVWFSSNEEWEETCFMLNTHEELDTVGRIRLRYNWGKGLHIPPASEYKQFTINWDGLCFSALSVGSNPDEWHVAIQDVPLDYFDRIEYYNPKTKKWELYEDL